jgi:excisionase family DNA binding protein
VISEDAKQKLLTTPEVAALFGVDPTAIARWKHDGRLPYFRTPGGHYRFAALDLYQLLAEQRTGPHPGVANRVRR